MDSRHGEGGEVYEDLALVRRFALAQKRRGLQPTTIESRSRNYQLLLRWLEPRRLLDATREDIEAFLDTRKLSSRGRYRWISDLHVFYGWAVLEELTDTDPTFRIARPRLPKLLPRPISNDELSVAIDLAPTVVRVWLLLAAYAGFRCIEMSRLTWEDVRDGAEPPVVLARGKGDKMRLVPLHPELAAALAVLPGRRLGPVFRTPDGKPRSPVAVSQAINGYLHDLGIESTAHKLRHLFATELYRTSGRDILLVRDLLGHSSVQTTEGYAAFDRAGAAAAVLALGTRPAAMHVDNETAPTVPSGPSRAGGG